MGEGLKSWRHLKPTPLLSSEELQEAWIAEFTKGLLCLRSHLGRPAELILVAVSPSGYRIS